MPPLHICKSFQATRVVVAGEQGEKRCAHADAAPGQGGAAAAKGGVPWGEAETCHLQECGGGAGSLGSNGGKAVAAATPADRPLAAELLLDMDAVAGGQAGAGACSADEESVMVGGLPLTALLAGVAQANEVMRGPEMEVGAFGSVPGTRQIQGSMGACSNLGKEHPS